MSPAPWAFVAGVFVGVLGDIVIISLLLMAREGS